MSPTRLSQCVCAAVLALFMGGPAHGQTRGSATVSPPPTVALKTPGPVSAPLSSAVKLEAARKVLNSNTASLAKDSIVLGPNALSSGGASIGFYDPDYVGPEYAAFGASGGSIVLYLAPFKDAALVIDCGIADRSMMKFDLSVDPSLPHAKGEAPVTNGRLLLVKPAKWSAVTLMSTGPYTKSSWKITDCIITRVQ